MCEKELLALVFFCHHVVSLPTWSTLYCKIDQKALKYLLEQKLHTDSQIKLLAKLFPFDFEIQYKKGKENLAANALSRIQGAELMSLMMSSV